MVQINFAQKSVTVKIVYYGPGMSGKTTNLEVVHQRAPESNKGDLTSISTDGDRTLFFDFMPLDLGTVAGMRTQFQLYTVPGQVYYNSTRKLVLQGVDGVIFVADSSASMMEENLESLRNLEENLREYGKDIDTIPMVIQYNKRDLPDALPVHELEARINRFGAPSFEAIANSGQGVFPTLKSLAANVLDTIHEQTGAAASPRPATESAGRRPAPEAPTMAPPAAPLPSTELPSAEVASPEAARSPVEATPAVQGASRPSVPPLPASIPLSPSVDATPEVAPAASQPMTPPSLPLPGPTSTAPAAPSVTTPEPTAASAAMPASPPATTELKPADPAPLRLATEPTPAAPAPDAAAPVPALPDSPPTGARATAEAPAPASRPATAHAPSSIGRPEHAARVRRAPGAGVTGAGVTGGGVPVGGTTVPGPRAGAAPAGRIRPRGGATRAVSAAPQQRRDPSMFITAAVVAVAVAAGIAIGGAVFNLI